MRISLCNFALSTVCNTNVARLTNSIFGYYKISAIMNASTNFSNRLMDLQSNMLNFAYTLTSNRDDAYDLMQDTMLKVLSNEDKYIENTNFKGWVFTIMRNIFINNYRRVVRSATVVDTD